MLERKIENYIKDLVNEDYSLQRAIDKANKTTIPSYRKRLLGLADLVAMAMSQNKTDLVDSLSKECGFLFGRLCLETAKVYDKMAIINDNMKKIRGLKNGTIKEI